MECEIYRDDELTHWGIKGMRWGIRRYQNKDGSLTPAGKKRLKAETDAVKKEEQVLKNRKAVKAKLEKLEARKKAVEDEKKALDSEDKKGKKSTDDAKPAKKSVKDMGDEELAYNIRRIQLEKQYAALTAEPEPVAKGNSFAKDFMDRSVVPAVQEAGRALIKDSLLKMGKKYLGLEVEETESSLDKLKAEVDRLKTEDQYRIYKKKSDDAAAAAAGGDKKKTESADTPGGSEAGSKGGTNPESKADATASPKGSNTSKAKTSDTVFEGVVEGAGSSSKTTSSGKRWTNNSDVIDADYWEVSDSSNTSAGRSYVSEVLGLPSSGLPAPKDDD